MSHPPTDPALMTQVQAVRWRSLWVLGWAGAPPTKTPLVPGVSPHTGYISAGATAGPLHYVRGYAAIARPQRRRLEGPSP